MAIRWADSADQHGIAREDALNAILNQIYHVEQFDEPRVESGARPDLFIGPSRDRPDDSRSHGGHYTAQRHPGLPRDGGEAEDTRHCRERSNGMSGKKTSGKKTKGGQDLSLEEQARFQALGDWAETADIGPDARITKASGPGAGRALLEAALGSPEAVKRAVGKPSLSSTGTSPSRTVRLPKDMDAQLLARSEMEHRKPSEILREALAQYLAQAS